MKRIVLFFCFLSAILLVSGCRKEPAPTEPVSSDTPPSATTGVTEPSGNEGSAEAELSSITFQKTYTKDGVNILDVFISLPEIKNAETSGQRAMNEFYSRELKEFEDRAETELLGMAEDEYNYCKNSGNEFKMCSSNIAFALKYDQNGFMSFTREIVHYFGGAHESFFMQADTFDMSTGTRVTLRELFPDASEDVYADICGNLISEIEKQIMAGDSELYWENWRSSLEYIDAESFYLEDGGIVVYFNPGDLGAYTSGVITFSVKYADFVPYNMIPAQLR